MSMTLKSIGTFINPTAQLGNKKHSFRFALITTFLCFGFSELYVYTIAKNPMEVGIYAIYLSIALIIYFAFRDGLLGGFVTTGITLMYYLYIIYTRHYSGQLLQSGVETTFVLGVIYLILVGIIGGLRQVIDNLIEKEGEERKRLESILEQLPIGILVTDEKGNLIHQNARVGTILGRRFPPLFKFGNGKQVDPTHVPITQVISHQKPIRGREYRVERKNGKAAYLQVSAAAIKNSQGKIVAATEVIEDITEQKELERLKDEFISIASHELKTPLTTIKGFTDIMLYQAKKERSPRKLFYLHKMQYQIERTIVLINQLLDVSRIQSGKLELDKEKIQFESFVKDAIKDLQQIAPTHKIIFKSAPPFHSVFIDKYRMYQVITNLVTNAVKYSPNSEKVVVNIQGADKSLTLSVKDFGIGISKRDLNFIFDRFFQAETRVRQSTAGLGLGLYIASQIVLKHEGKIWAESEKGKGSTFYFSLPYYP